MFPRHSEEKGAGRANTLARGLPLNCSPWDQTSGCSVSRSQGYKLEQEVKIAMFLELFSLLRGELLSLSTLSRGEPRAGVGMSG